MSFNLANEDELNKRHQEMYAGTFLLIAFGSNPISQIHYFY